MALVSEGFPARNAHGRENAPATKETSLSGREPDFLDGQQALVVKHVPMDQCGFLALYSSEKCSPEELGMGNSSLADVQAGQPMRK